MLKNNYVLRYIFIFILIVLAQVTVLNRISFLNYGTPLVYIYLILKLPICFNRNLIVFIGFLLGFIIDIFCSTPGINAAATTLMAFLRRPIQGLFFVVEDLEEEIPSVFTQKWTFVKWIVLLTCIHHFVLFSLESFSYFNLIDILLRVILSSILSIILMFAFEGFFLNQSSNRE